MKSADSSLETLHSPSMAPRTYSSAHGKGVGLGKEAKEAEREFALAMDDDFDTPAALVRLFALAKRINGACSEGSATSEEAKKAGAKLESLLSILALAPKTDGGQGAEEKVRALCGELGVEAHGGLKPLVLALISARAEARKKKDFARSDAIRKRLADSGIALEDRKDGTVGWRIA